MTKAGNTICNFNSTLGKQPFELLILGSAVKENKVNIPDSKLMVSVPSAVHSHKPPLIGIHIMFKEICEIAYYSML